MADCFTGYDELQRFSVWLTHTHDDRMLSLPRGYSIDHICMRYGMGQFLRKPLKVMSAKVMDFERVSPWRCWIAPKDCSRAFLTCGWTEVTQERTRVQTGQRRP